MTPFAARHIPTARNDGRCVRLDFRIMARKAQRSSNAKRDRAKTPVPTPDPWHPPSIDECEVETYLTEPDSTNRIILKQVTWNGQLVDYAVIHVTLIGPDTWHEVSRIDCCHANVHRHSGRNNGKKPEIIRQIRNQLDVQQSVGSSFDEIYDNYEEFRERT